MGQHPGSAQPHRMALLEGPPIELEAEYLIAHEIGILDRHGHGDALRQLAPLLVEPLSSTPGC